MRSIDVSIITVTWNSASTIADQIGSVISACRDVLYEQIIVDNASVDNTIEQICTLAPKVTLIRNEHNSGFAAANNRAIVGAKGRYFLFLNPDMRLEPGSLDVLVAWMDTNPRAGIAGCRLVNEDGRDQDQSRPRRFPCVWEQVALILKLPHIFPNLFQRYLQRDKDLSKTQRVDTVRGSCMLVRRSVVDRLDHAFDPRYFIWLEDVDLCKEVSAMGLEVWHVGTVHCVDYVGRSFAQQKNLYAKQKQFLTSLLRYFRKWHPWYQWIWIAFVIPIGLLAVRLRVAVQRVSGVDMKQLSRYH